MSSGSIDPVISTRDIIRADGRLVGADLALLDAVKEPPQRIRAVLEHAPEIQRRLSPQRVGR